MLRKSSLLASGGAALAALALTLSTVAVAALARGTINVSLTDNRADPQQVMRVNDTAVLRGTATNVPAGSVAVLQVRNGGGAWRGVARGPVGGGGNIHLSWHIGPKARGSISWRVIIRHGGALIGRTGPVSMVVGSAYVACRTGAPSPSSGEGVIVGGLYDWGGGTPGFDHCSTGGYTAQAIDQSGNSAASQSVGGGHGYALMVKPGTYVVQAGGCNGPRVTVAAGQVVHANTFCHKG